MNKRLLEITQKKIGYTYIYSVFAYVPSLVSIKVQIPPFVRSFV